MGLIGLTERGNRVKSSGVSLKFSPRGAPPRTLAPLAGEALKASTLQVLSGSATFIVYSASGFQTKNQWTISPPSGVAGSG